MRADINVAGAERLHELLCQGRWYRSLPPELQQRILAASRARDSRAGLAVFLEIVKDAAAPARARWKP